MRGPCPRAPGIFRFTARKAAKLGGWAAPAIPAAESALGFHPWRSLSLAQVIAFYTRPLESAANLHSAIDTSGFGYRSLSLRANPKIRHVPNSGCRSNDCQSPKGWGDKSSRIRLEWA